MMCIVETIDNTIKNGAYVINLDKYADVGTHCIALYVKIIKLLISILLV